MKTIIAGSRDGFILNDVYKAVNQSGFEITEVVSGTARGVDRLGEEWGEANNISIKKFPANWDSYGKRAGYMRNIQMAEYAESLVALWDGESKGTKHMIDIAKSKGLSVYVYKKGEEL